MAEVPFHYDETGASVLESSQKAAMTPEQVERMANEALSLTAGKHFRVHLVFRQSRAWMIVLRRRGGEQEYLLEVNPPDPEDDLEAFKLAVLEKARRLF